MDGKLMKNLAAAFLYCVFSCHFPSLALRAQIAQQIVTIQAAPSGGGAPVNCGQTTETSNQTGTNNTFLETPCTTGSDASGYGVNSIQVYTAATGSGKVYVAIYPDIASGCGGGLTHCASGSPVCSDTSGITPAANSWNADTVTAVTSSCGTLAASTLYWLVQNNNSATYGTGYNGTTCSPSGVFDSGTAGTFPSLNKAAANGDGSCKAIYAVLQPK